LRRGRYWPYPGIRVLRHFSSRFIVEEVGVGLDLLNLVYCAITMTSFTGDVYFSGGIFSFMYFFTVLGFLVNIFLLFIRPGLGHSVINVAASGRNVAPRSSP
jgi:hypothetical protein